MTEVKRRMGVIPDKFDMRDYKLRPGIAMAVHFPETFELGERGNIKDQGEVGSCVAHVISEILEYHHNNKFTLSTNFIYGIQYKLFGSRGPGMSLREACKIVKDWGDPQEKYCKGNNEITRVYSIAEKAFRDPDIMADAKNFKITSYAKLSADSDIKYSLINHGPVLACIEWFDQNKVTELGMLSKAGEFEGYHAIMIYGWGEEGWLCQNSWGTEWGDQGCFTLPFDYGIYESYSLICGEPSDDINKPKHSKCRDFFYCISNFFVNLGKNIYNIILGVFKR